MDRHEHATEAVANAYGGMPLRVDCPNCRSTDLDLPEHARGDDAVACRRCGARFRFREVEAFALEDTRRLLARRMLEAAGFSRVEVLDSPRPQNCIYVCRP